MLCLRDKHAIEWAVLNLRTSGVHTAVRKFTKCFCRDDIQPDLHNNLYEGGEARGIVLDLQGRSPGLRETRPTCLKPNSYLVVEARLEPSHQTPCPVFFLLHAAALGILLL